MAKWPPRDSIFFFVTFWSMRNGFVPPGGKVALGRIIRQNIRRANRKVSDGGDRDGLWRQGKISVSDCKYGIGGLMD
jgi:hypothetical protein